MKLKKIVSVPNLGMSVIALLLLSAIVFVISLCITNSWWSGFMAGLATEIFGIVVTLLFVDFVLEKRDESKRRRIEVIAFSQMRKDLQSHIHFLAMLANVSGEDRNTSVNEIFNDKYFEEISALDIMERSNYVLKAPWCDIIREHFMRFHRQISEILDRYIMVLDIDTIDLLEEVKSSVNHSIMVRLRELQKAMEDFGVSGLKGPKAGELLAKQLKEYASPLMKLVERHNTVTPAGEQIDKIQVGSRKADSVYF